LWRASLAREEVVLPVEEDVHVDEEVHDVAVVEVVSLREMGSRGKDSMPRWGRAGRWVS
jgi:hypothetical protein